MRFLWTVLAVAAFVMMGCGGPAKKLKIVATTDLLAEMATAIAGEDLADVQTLVPAGQDPHLYILTPEQVDSVKEADLVIANGLNLEEAMIAPLKDAAGDRLVQPCDVLAPSFLLRTEGTYDPHVWHEPATWVLCGKPVMDAIAAKRPGTEKELLKRYDAWTGAVLSAKAKLDQILETLPISERSFITLHAGLRYFGTTQKLQSLSLDAYGKLNKQAKDKVRVAFQEVGLAEESAKGLADLAKSLGLETPEGALITHGLTDAQGKRHTYPEMLLANAEMIAKALGSD